MRFIFQCVVEAFLENGIKGVAQMVPGGTFVYAVGESACQKYRAGRRHEKSATISASRRNRPSKAPWRSASKSFRNA